MQTITLSAILSVIITPVYLAFREAGFAKLGAAFAGLPDTVGLGLIIGGPIALVALVVVLLPARVAWFLFETFINRFVRDARLVAAFAAPISILVGNACLILLAWVSFVSTPLMLAFAVFVVAIGTPAAILISPFVAWRIHRPVQIVA